MSEQTTGESPSILFVFPGQGSQYPGIGGDLHADLECVRETYAEASDAISVDLAAMSFSEPDERIHLTRFTQPVLLTHSIACLRAFRERTGGRVGAAAAAGHSLGEYSALVAAGILDFADAVRLVHTRGTLMSEHGAGEMEALPLELEIAGPLADRHYCAVAACNLPDQTVVGGLGPDLDRLVAELGELYPRKRSTRLKTEGAFHTFYMVDAARRFREHLESARFADSTLPVLSNYTGAFHDPEPEAIRSRLFTQLFHPVLWHRNLLAAVEHGVDTMIEFGGGIGRDGPPSEKRANLEGVIRKAFRHSERPPHYRSVINRETLAATAAAFAA
jgi:[acyl-carrier-protein] S-malonyltransferase